MTCVLASPQVILLHAQVGEPLMHFNFFLLLFLPSFSSFPFLLISHPYDSLTNLNGEDEFGTNIFKIVHDRRNIPLRGDFIKIYVGKSVGCL